MLREVQGPYIRTYVETTACFTTDFFMQVMQFVRCGLLDIELMEPDANLTVSTTDFLKTSKRWPRADWDGALIIRIPVICGVNDSDENMSQATARFISVNMGLEVIDILSLHRLGE